MTNNARMCSYLFSYLDSFHSGFAKVLFNFYVDLDITGVAASRRTVTSLEIMFNQGKALKDDKLFLWVWIQ